MAQGPEVPDGCFGAKKARGGDEVNVFVCSAVEADDVASDDIVDFAYNFFVWNNVVSVEVGEDREEIDVEDEDSVL